MTTKINTSMIELHTHTHTHNRVINIKKENKESQKIYRYTDTRKASTSFFVV